VLVAIGFRGAGRSLVNLVRSPVRTIVAAAADNGPMAVFVFASLRRWAGRPHTAAFAGGR
jgi:hypothetical protein